jgi:hypothetical protein
MKPVDWPRYMIVKRLRSGQPAYYWNARQSDVDAGFTLHREALGTDYGAARARAEQLNAHLDGLRSRPKRRLAMFESGTTRDLCNPPMNQRTLDWLAAAANLVLPYV